MGAQAAASPFRRIDTHTHVHRNAPALIGMLEKTNWTCLSICDSRAIGDEAFDLEEVLQSTAAAQRASHGRLAWAATFDARGFESPGFAGRTIARLQQCFRDGALGVKIWKNIGMGIRSKSGAYLLPDDPALSPIFDAIQKADRTLIAHLAEPDGAWLPLDDRNPEIGYYGKHPEWHMGGRPGAPSKERILAARERILERHPKLRVIGCHLGSEEEHLDRLAKRLDAHPNFVVDVAARVRYLARGDRENVRAFLLRYQDRVLYGTDFTLGDGTDQAAASSLEQTHEREWSFFAEDGVVSYRGKEVRGLGLPEAVLRKIFHDNASRWLPGIGG